ncbi:class III signal peptide-containing protein [uncultured Adlercreutzia sp.]|uniref:class III signal peptide-containing protein n=1 Tax=uncultured Adlercreutzia sp. TaxID=875803 RepID=UPI0025E2EB66|nr:class III signal peptide-containing protein [uncultured Adlercreutzia sp.]
MEKIKGLTRRARRFNRAFEQRCRSWFIGAQQRLADTRGQGTTEYAILVGVLVVIAIIAITLFRPKLQELWDAIAAGINSL